MTQVSGTSRWLVAAVGALLLGILGMHALGLHGVPASVFPEPSHATNPMTVGESHEHSPSVGDSNSEHGMHEMAGLCFALLAAGLLFLGAALLRRRFRHKGFVLGDRNRRSCLRFVLPSVRDNGPPYVWSFSVIRC